MTVKTIISAPQKPIKLFVSGFLSGSSLGVLAVALMLGTFHPDLPGFLSQLQTFEAVAISVIGTVLAATILYVSAMVLVLHERKKEASRHLLSDTGAAAIMYESAHRLIIEFTNYKTIDEIPKTLDRLIDFKIFPGQSTDVAFLAGKLSNAIAVFQSLESDVKEPKKQDSEINDSIIEIIYFCSELIEQCQKEVGGITGIIPTNQKTLVDTVRTDLKADLEAHAKKLASLERAKDRVVLEAW